jgi:hypothetical protein
MLLEELKNIKAKEKDLIVTQISLISKLLGKRFLELKIVKNRDSYWIPREKRKFCKED